MGHLLDYHGLAAPKVKIGSALKTLVADSYMEIPARLGLGCVLA